MAIIYKFYPNGQYTQGFSSVKRRDKATHPLEGYSKRRDEDNNVSLQWERRDAKVKDKFRYSFIGKEYKSALTGTLFLCVDMSEKMHPTFYWKDDLGKEYECEFPHPIGQLLKRGEIIDLGLSESRILEKTSGSRKKLLSMTGNMARNLANGVYLLEKEHGKHLLSFLTLTLPSLPPDDMDKIVENWGQLTNEILKWLKYALEKCNIEFKYVYCTEIQEKRLEKLHEYAPHLHIVFRGRHDKKSNWLISPKRVRIAWLRILSRCVGHAVKSNSVENLQVIKRSAARYLSKYISKGVRKGTQRHQTMARKQLHCQWGGMSRILAKAIKTLTQKIGGTRESEDIAILLATHVPSLAGGEVVKYHKTAYIPLGQYSDSGTARYLKVSVGCLAYGLLEGGLELLLDAVYKAEHDKNIKDLLNSLDGFWFN